MKYVPLVSIARDIGSSAAALMRHCAEKHIPMVVVKYKNEKVKQAFVRIRDRNEVLSFRPVRVLTNHKRVTTQSSGFDLRAERTWSIS